MDPIVTCIMDTCIIQIKDKEEDKEVNFMWVTRPERAKDEVKQALRAQSQPVNF